jgi:hypothetical protein
MLWAYFDETERGPWQGVAGVLFTEPKAHKFERKWSALFGKYGGCHWVELVHRHERFEGIELAQRDRLMKEAIKILGSYAEAMVIVGLKTQDAKDLALPTDGFKSPYAICCMATMQGVARWCQANGMKQTIHYVFESGHLHEAETHRFLKEVAGDESASNIYRLGGYTFLRKGACSLLDAPDTVAWEASKFKADTVDRLGSADVRPPRGSWRAIVGTRPKRVSLVSLSRKTLTRIHNDLSKTLALSEKEWRDQGSPRKTRKDQ